MKQLFAVALLSLLAGAAQAQSEAAPKGDDKELKDLLNILQQETAVATRTRLNSDYVPGIVTVLEGEQLEALGVATAWEALSFVPGMQTVQDTSGSPAVVVRGIDFPFNSGNIQILINSVPLTRADSGISASSLLIPVEQIERIEVIRGPGSVIYGDFAFMGLVNIVTRREGQRVYGRIDNRVHSGGARGAWKEGDQSVAAAVSRSTSDNAPVSIPRARDEETFGTVTVQDRGFTLSGEEAKRTFRATNGPHFDETSWNVDARYGRDLLPKLHGEVSAGYLRNNLDNSTSVFDGHVTTFAANVLYDALPHQSWLAGVDESISTIGDAAHLPPPLPGQPPGTPQPLVSHVDRRVTGVLLHDRIDVSEAVSVTLGARRDAYSDLQRRVTPRASVVWRWNDRNIVKAQYAEGFRPPTFFELYTPALPGVTPHYPFEVNATTELNYIHKTAGAVFRSTLFQTRITDMLRPGGVTTPGSARARGFELEYSQQITPRLKLDSNVSRVTTRDPRHDNGPDPAAADWLANLGVMYEPIHDTFLGAHFNHVGGRSSASGYDLFDVTVSRHDLFIRGVGVRVGVKNAFNDHPVYLLVRPVGAPEPITFPGRSVWMQLSWKR